MDRETLEEWVEKQRAKGRELRQMVQPMVALENDAQDGWDVEGYATTFDKFYTLIRTSEFEAQEMVDARAFDGCDMSDFILRYDHEGRVFARNRNKTLEAEPDAHGLRVRGKLRGTQLGRDILEEVKGGYSDRMSFAFTVAKDKREAIEDHETGFITIRRTILEIGKLYDVSIVSFPANDATEVFARSAADGANGWAAQEVRALKARRNDIARLKLKIRLMEVQNT